MKTANLYLRLAPILLALAVGGCTSPKRAGRGSGSLSPLAQLKTGESPELAFERASELELEERFGEAEKLYREIALNFGNRPVGGGDPVAAAVSNETYGSVIKRKLPFLQCKKESAARYFRTSEKLIKAMVSALNSADPAKIEPLLNCESVTGPNMQRVEPPRLPTEQARWIADLRHAVSGDTELLEFSVLDQRIEAERVLVTATGFRDRPQLTFDLRSTLRGWTWWATVGGPMPPARAPEQPLPSDATDEEIAP